MLFFKAKHEPKREPEYETRVDTVTHPAFSGPTWSINRKIKQRQKEGWELVNQSADPGFGGFGAGTVLTFRRPRT